VLRREVKDSPAGLDRCVALLCVALESLAADVAASIVDPAIDFIRDYVSRQREFEPQPSLQPGIFSISRSEKFQLAGYKACNQPP